jgi:hypothetical protein
MTVTLAMSDDLDEVRRRAVLERAHHLATFFGRELHLDLR